MSATVCPACNKPLPAAVVNGPPQAVVRCDQCQTLLLWSNGRVMRSARSSTGTMMGMPAVTGPKKDADPPLSALKPEDEAPQTAAPTAKPSPAKTPPPRSATQPLARVQPQKVPVTGLDNVPTRVSAPPPELLRKDDAPATAKPAEKAAGATKPTEAPKSPAAKPAPPAAPARPMAPSPSKPIAVAPAKPMAASPSKPNPMLPPPATAAPQGALKPTGAAPATSAPSTPGAEEGNKPQALVANVAEVPSMSGGPMVDPSAWFSGGETGDVALPEKLPAAPAAPPMVIESTKPPSADPTGAAPLPPPPQLQPLKPIDIAAPGTEPTPAMGTFMPELRSQDQSGPIVIAKQPSAPIRVAPTAPPRRDATPSPKKPNEPHEPKEPKEMGQQPSAPIKVAPTTPARKDPTPPPAKPTPATALPKTTMLGLPTPTREPPRAQPLPERTAAPTPTASPTSGLTDDDIGVPIEIAEDETPSRPPQPMAASEPANVNANAPTLMAEREISAQALPPPPLASDGAPTPMAGESMEMESLRGPRFVLPEISRRVLAIGGGVAALLLIIVVAVALTRGPRRPVPARAPEP
ncbi:MAG: hypothetical protein JWN44_6428, partial [Myxococcales bacterium]|nr:hypothetical protein [Myxococcales bacterium]